MQRDEITTQRDEIAMLHSQMDEVMAGHMDEAWNLWATLRFAQAPGSF